jgi:hypothetical protein
MYECMSRREPRQRGRAIPERPLCWLRDSGAACWHHDAVGADGLPVLWGRRQADRGWCMGLAGGHCDRCGRCCREAVRVDGCRGHGERAGASELMLTGEPGLRGRTISERPSGRLGRSAIGRHHDAVDAEGQPVYLRREQGNGWRCLFSAEQARQAASHVNGRAHEFHLQTCTRGARHRDRRT